MDNIIRCSTNFEHTLGKAWTIVGQTYSTSRYVNEFFNDTAGASSELGVG